MTHSADAYLKAVIGQNKTSRAVLSGKDKKPKAPAKKAATTTKKSSAAAKPKTKPASKSASKPASKPASSKAKKVAA
jgi:histone H1/5